MSKQQQQQELQSLNPPYTTPIIMEHDTEGKNINYDNDNMVTTTGCFRVFSCCFDSRRRHHEGETTGFLYHKQSGDLMNQETWFMKRAKSLKEYSELVAGPKWKNFIRRFSRKTRNRSGSNTTPFQYDPQSYALNFNDGGNHDEDDDLLPRSFSTRFAPPSRSTQL